MGDDGLGIVRFVVCLVVVGFDVCYKKKIGLLKDLLLRGRIQTMSNSI